MSLELLRIDERLLHGQVLVGWGARLGIDDYLIADDTLAGSAWEQGLYASGLGEGQRVSFLTVEAAAGEFSRLDAGEDPCMLLTRGTSGMRRLAEAGALKGRAVNLGGLHAGEGRKRVLDYVYLDEEIVRDLEAIAARTASISARDLPTSPAVSLADLLAMWRAA